MAKFDSSAVGLTNEALARLWAIEYSARIPEQYRSTITNTLVDVGAELIKLLQERDELIMNNNVLAAKVELLTELVKKG